MIYVSDISITLGQKRVTVLGNHVYVEGLTLGSSPGRGRVLRMAAHPVARNFPPGVVLPGAGVGACLLLGDTCLSLSAQVKLLSGGSPGCRPCPWPRPSLVTARGPRPSVPARGSSPWSPATTSWTVKVTMLPR